MTSTPRSARRRGPDRSLILSSLAWKDNPDFINTAIDLGNYITCQTTGCRLILGIGINTGDAERDADQNDRGVYENGEWHCDQHAED